MALLEASGIGKNFGDTKVLKDISLTLEQGEALAIIGCHLRCISDHHGSDIKSGTLNL